MSVKKSRMRRAEKIGVVTVEFERGCPLCGGALKEVEIINEDGFKVFQPVREDETPDLLSSSQVASGGSKIL